MAAAWIAFHVTDRCQLDCQHCLRDPEQKPKDLPLALIEKVLSEARRLYRSSQVALTGGEPTLHPDFVGIIDAIVERGMTWHMVSNARRFPQVLERLREKPARLEALTALNLSLDGATEEVHDSIRGAGSFREVMTAAMLCQARGIPFVLQMVLNAKNVHQIEAMGLLAAELGAARVSFSMLQPSGTQNDAELFMSPKAWRAAAARIERLSGTLRISVAQPEGFYREQPFHVCDPFASQQLHVTVEGKLNLCCVHADLPGEPRDVVADLAETSLSEAHGRLLALIHEVQAARLAEIRAGGLTEWDHFPCNWCLKYFGKPHWEGDGASGPEARRERWRGAWAPEKREGAAGETGGRRLPVVR